MKIREKYMRRCMQLAKNSWPSAAPNPMVGSVVVHQDRIIGEGYTSAYGGPHAEVNAIGSVTDSSLLVEATLYVSLEPCSHFGKTPPCTDLIIKNNIPEVVIGVRDPNKIVAGSGIEKLRKAGCNVIEGVLEKECRELNRRFFTFHQEKRPFIILKWAQTSDGFIAPEDSVRNDNPEPYWISNSYSRQLVHQWRSQEQAILVGTNTVIHDNPGLSTRLWFGKSPTRVILDRELKIPEHFRIMDQGSKTIVLTEVNDPTRYLEGIQYHQVDFSKNIAEQACQILWENNVLSVVVEGGAKTLEIFITSGLWDEARIFTGQAAFSSGLKAPNINGVVFDQVTIGTDKLEYLRHD
ncbi:MAG: bifunctional diaminohydroxyphosphoribosylaminopyrimidine deaminase/5-amino-6-(5-phosphoribosylamino)uracil reductase RibD [Flavobacteriaceae bacterium]